MFTGSLMHTICTDIKLLRCCKFYPSSSFTSLFWGNIYFVAISIKLTFLLLKLWQQRLINLDIISYVLTIRLYKNCPNEYHARAGPINFLLKSVFVMESTLNLT